MKLSIKTEGEVSVIEFKDTHNTIVNAFRRIILDEVPTFAIEEVEVAKNDSPLYDETIAHRLGLIPLKTDLKSYNLKNKCSCGGAGCAMCEVKLTLKAQGDGYVFSSEIKSDDPQVVPVDGNIPITKLFGEDAKLELNLKAILGIGLEHAKWSPAHTYLRDTNSGVELVIEPFGQLSAKDIFNKSVDILIEKVDELEEKL